MASSTTWPSANIDIPLRYWYWYWYTVCVSVVSCNIYYCLFTSTHILNTYRWNYELCKILITKIDVYRRNNWHTGKWHDIVEVWRNKQVLRQNKRKYIAKENKTFEQLTPYISRKCTRHGNWYHNMRSWLKCNYTTQNSCTCVCTSHNQSSTWPEQLTDYTPAL